MISARHLIKIHFKIVFVNVSPSPTHHLSLLFSDCRTRPQCSPCWGSIVHLYTLLSALPKTKINWFCEDPISLYPCGLSTTKSNLAWRRWPAPFREAEFPFPGEGEGKRRMAMQTFSVKKWESKILIIRLGLAIISLPQLYLSWKSFVIVKRWLNLEKFILIRRNFKVISV